MMITLDGQSLTLDELVAIAQGESIELSPAARERIAASRRVVDEFADHDDPTYGINTGFGNFAEVRIPHASLAELQINLLRSHAAGIGEPLAVSHVRATMALRANVLAKGFSGIRLDTIDLLMAMVNRGVIPVVPSRGSVGASGDLAPLAHLALVLIGEGYATIEEPVGERGLSASPGGPDKVRPTMHSDANDRGAGLVRPAIPGAAALARVGLQPVALAPKEGLALINGTQPSTALLGLALASAERLARAADIAAALSIDGLQGSTKPFDPRIHAARPFTGQAIVAANLARLLAGSAINAGHADCGRVQDAYSMRCAPQVHGTARDAFAYAHAVFDVEANAATDNPMVFADTREIVSGGNFHGAPVSVAADLLCLGVAQLATISERRSDRLVNPASSGLPAFLTRHGGLQSGLMLAQVSAAALTSELKSLGHPASVDSIPTSGNREDHVSMSMAAGLKAMRAVDLARHVVAIELLCAAQAIDLLQPLASSAVLMQVHGALRAHVPTLEHDRPPAPDIASIVRMIDTGELERASADKVN